VIWHSPEVRPKLSPGQAPGWVYVTCLARRSRFSASGAFTISPPQSLIIFDTHTLSSRAQCWGRIVPTSYITKQLYVQGKIVWSKTPYYPRADNRLSTTTRCSIAQQTITMTGRHQTLPTYDFLTGGEDVPPAPPSRLRETFRASQFPPTAGKALNCELRFESS